MSDHNDDVFSPTGFDELLGEAGDASSFSWDDQGLEAHAEETTHPVVSFRLGEDYFSVAAETVREIIGNVEVTALPGAPPHIDGITVLRRQVLGLVSLQRFLNLSGPEARPTARTQTARTLILETTHYSVGLPVDEVTGLGEWPSSALDPDALPTNLHPKTREYARGAVELDDKLHVFLDLESLLDDAAIR